MFHMSIIPHHTTHNLSFGLPKSQTDLPVVDHNIPLGQGLHIIPPPEVHQLYSGIASIVIL